LTETKSLIYEQASEKVFVWHRANH
jgi:hypothetical protein